MYFMVKDINEDQIFNASSHLKTQISDHITFDGTISYQNTQSNNYRMMNDLLGGLPIENHDFFTEYDLNVLETNEKISEGEKFNYDYDLFHQKLNAYSLLRFSYNRFDYELGIDFTQTSFKRIGNYKNEYDLINSFGESKTYRFNDFGLKAHVLYKMNGKNFIGFNTAYLTVAPSINDAFTNIRYLNVVPEDLKSSRIISGDLNYIHRGKKLKTKLSTYWTEITDQTDVQIYYLDDDGEANGFLYQSLYGLNTRYIGVELGIDYQITSTIKAKGVNN